MWPVDDIGKNSVMPSTIAITILSIKVIVVAVKQRESKEIKKGDNNYHLQNFMTWQVIAELWVF
jgi:hypothetical protein